MTAAPAPPRRKPPAPPPPVNGHKTTPTGTVRLGKATKTAEGVRIVLNAVEGFGKTSAIAYAPNPVLIQTKGETGYQTLYAHDRVPQIDTAIVPTWADLLAVVDQAVGAGYGVLGIDALGGAESLCHEFVCDRDYKGNMGKGGFTSFQEGPGVAVTDWLKLLAVLDLVRESGTHIVLLSHAKIAPFRNPMGADYDKYVADCHAKTWSVTHKWADAVLFGRFTTVVDVERPNAKKGKGVGGSTREMYAEHRDAFDTKNRFGMDESFEIPNDPTAIWPTIWSQIERSKTP